MPSHRGRQLGMTGEAEGLTGYCYCVSALCLRTSRNRRAAMNSVTIAERACERTVTHTDRAPNLMNAVPTAVAARNGQKNISAPL
jgi:hypothetical protein